MHNSSEEEKEEDISCRKQQLKRSLLFFERHQDLISLF